MKILNRKELKYYRKKLRNRSTSAEATLWTLIKNRRINGKKFRRQYSIGNYIVDFYCPEERLIIELDGDSHGDYYKIELDSDRDNELKEMGYKILRFENRFVFQYPDFVLNEIISLFSK